jgi:hypothetical protein
VFVADFSTGRVPFHRHLIPACHGGLWYNACTGSMARAAELFMRERREFPTKRQLKAAFPIENRANLSPADFAHIAEAVAGHRSMRHAVDWFVRQNPPLAPADMVTQDEFSHDILVAYPGGLWLVYDST